MNVDIADATLEEGVAIDEAQDLDVSCDHGTGQVRKGQQQSLALTEATQSEFTNDEGMRYNQAGVEKPASVASPARR